MQRPYNSAFSITFATCLLATGCERTLLCDYTPTASNDGQTRLALLVDTSEDIHDVLLKRATS